MLMREGVILAGLQPEMRIVKKHADRIWKKHGERCVITSAVDREHSPGSLHPFGYALDFESKLFGGDQCEIVAQEMRDALGPKYQVFFEGDHFHVEYDPK